MTDKPTLLCFSRDQALLDSRVAVLKAYRVAPVSTVEEMRGLPPGTTFDLILLCHTLKKEDCESAREIIQERWPAAKVLYMTKSEKNCAALDGEPAVRGLDGPAVLLQRLAALMHPVPQPEKPNAAAGLAYL